VRIVVSVMQIAFSVMMLFGLLEIVPEPSMHTLSVLILGALSFQMWAIGILLDRKDHSCN